MPPYFDQNRRKMIFKNHFIFAASFFLPLVQLQPPGPTLVPGVFAYIYISLWVLASKKPFIVMS